MKHRELILNLGVFVVAGIFTVDAIIGLGTPAMPIKDRFLAEVETLANLDSDDLTVAGGGYSWGLYGRNAYMKFRVTGDTDRLIVVELTRPLNLFGWRLAGYSDE